MQKKRDREGGQIPPDFTSAEPDKIDLAEIEEDELLLDQPLLTEEEWREIDKDIYNSRMYITRMNTEEK
jgi:hypothetical protein